MNTYRESDDRWFEQNVVPELQREYQSELEHASCNPRCGWQSSFSALVRQRIEERKVTLTENSVTPAEDSSRSIRLQWEKVNVLAVCAAIVAVVICGAVQFWPVQKETELAFNQTAPEVVDNSNSSLYLDPKFGSGLTETKSISPAGAIPLDTNSLQWFELGIANTFELPMEPNELLKQLFEQLLDEQLMIPMPEADKKLSKDHRRNIFASTENHLVSNLATSFLGQN